MDSSAILMSSLGWDTFHQQRMRAASMLGSMGNLEGSMQTAGGMMSKGMSVGAPMMLGAAGMLGLDPLSLGVRAGTAAWKGGAGILGAGLAGVGTLAGVATIGAGIAWGGGQMMSGAQQQMALNQSLSRNYNFMNTSGGTGFTSLQGFRVGEEVRSMVGEFGSPSFSELSRLAVNMGRMGLDQNVRTVKEFRDKFKQMVTAVKTIATELGTTLEEAQKMMASMRQVGIFGSGQAIGATKGMRLAATAGGLATSEVSSMMNIGAQISRSVGGLGGAGAMGGMLSIGQVGTAVKIGAMSEEDVYNATGLTGAEGRQAFATEMMSRSAQFLKSKRGRWFLASVAGEDGTLDESAVAEWMTGGVSVARTQMLANQNKVKVGRANFIRNEGRLRGAALEKFGMTLQAGVYKQWLQQKGFDPSDMNDHAMLAFQRFSGMGRDESDTMMKLIENLPEINRSQSMVASQMELSDLRTMRAKNSGFTGMKGELQRVRAGVQGRLQQWGADLLEEGTHTVASFFNRVTKMYEEHTNAEVTNLLNAVRGGNAMAGSAELRFGRTFGGAAGAGMGGAGLSVGAVAQSKADEAYRSFGSKINAVSKAHVTDRDRRVAGDFREWMTDTGSKLDSFGREKGVEEFLKDRASLSGEDAALYKEFQQSVPDNRMAMISRLEEAAGVPVGEGIGADLQRKQKMMAEYAAGTEGAYHTVEESQRALGKQLLGNQETKFGEFMRGMTNATLSTVIPTLAAGKVALAAGEVAFRLFNGDDSDDWTAPSTRGILGGISDRVSDFFSGHRKLYRQGGDLMEDSEFRQNLAALSQGKGEDYDAATSRLMQLRGLKQRGELKEGLQVAEHNLLGKARGLHTLDTELQKLGVTDISKVTDVNTKKRLLAKVREAADDKDLTLENLQNFRGVVQTAVDEQAERNMRQAQAEWRISQAFEVGRYERMGVAEYQTETRNELMTSFNEVGKALLDPIRERAKEVGRDVAISEASIDGQMLSEMSPEKLLEYGIQSWGTDEKVLKLTEEAGERLDKAMKGTGVKGSVETGREAIGLALAASSADIGDKDAFLAAHRDRDKAFSKMSVAQKRAFIGAVAGTEAGEHMAVALGRHERLSSLNKSYEKKGYGKQGAKYGAAMAALGLDISKDEAQAMVRTGPEGAMAQLEAMLREGGATKEQLATKEGQAFMKDIKTSMQLLQEGKTGEAASLMGSAKATTSEAIAKAFEQVENKRAAAGGDPSAKIVAAINELPGKLAGIISKGEGGDKDASSEWKVYGPI